MNLLRWFRQKPMTRQQLLAFCKRHKLRYDGDDPNGNHYVTDVHWRSPAYCGSFCFVSGLTLSGARKRLAKHRKSFADGKDE